MQQAEKVDWITAEEYLEGEKFAEVRHELIDGEVWAMAGASERHNLIAGNIFGEFRQALKGNACRPFTSDMKVKVDEDFFYPDVMVVCEEEESHDYFSESPVILVEVLSESTRRMDQLTKRHRYVTLPTLQEYVLVEQDFIHVEIFRRSSGWQSQHYYEGDTVVFESLKLELPIAEVYRWVEFKEVEDSEQR